MPDGRMIVSGPGRALLSWTAARSEQVPAAVAQAPSPGLASTASSVVSTVNVAARAAGESADAARKARRTRTMRAARESLMEPAHRSRPRGHAKDLLDGA